MLRTFNPPSLLTFLNTGVPYQRANLFTFELQSGTILRLTDHDVDVDKGGGLGLFSHSGPIVRRTNVKQKRGIEVSQMTVNIYAQTNQLIANVPWMRAIRAGMLDYAKVTLDVGVFAIGAPQTLLGWYNWFSGQVAAVPSVDLMMAEVIIKSQMSRLDVMMPRNLVQPGCLNSLFDAGCGLSKATWTVSGNVVSNNIDGSISLAIGPTPADGFYNEGAFNVLAGDNIGQVRKIKRNVGNIFYLFAPLPFPLPVSTSISVVPGCDKSDGTCNTKFGNKPRFRGMPFVPVPETVL